MIVVFKLTRWIYKTLAGGATPAQIAYGLCLGIFVALMPFSWPLLAIFIALALFTRASVWLLMLSAVLTAPLRLLFLEDWAWSLGHSLLENESLKPVWVKVLNLPVIAILHFERYAMLGGFVLALAISIVIFYPICRLVVLFREKIQARADQYRIVRWWKGFWLTRALGYVIGGGS